MAPAEREGIPLKPFDIIVLAFVVSAALRGFGRGLVGMAAGLASFLIALFVARATYLPLAQFLDKHFGFARAVQGSLVHVMPAGNLLVPGVSQSIAQTTNSVVTAITFIGVLFVVESVLGLIASQIGRIPNALPLIGPVNRILGLAFAGLEALAVAAAVLLLLEPLASSGALGSLSPYVVDAPLSHQLWLLARHFAPLLGKLS
ncbi:MAG: CvpA family protein [Thermaerobacter sp.]|nr:CvpA family protein [Thermaerobacter sp.]